MCVVHTFDPKGGCSIFQALLAVTIDYLNSGFRCTSLAERLTTVETYKGIGQAGADCLVVTWLHSVLVTVTCIAFITSWTPVDGPSGVIDGPSDLSLGVWVVGAYTTAVDLVHDATPFGYLIHINY